MIHDVRPQTNDVRPQTNGHTKTHWSKRRMGSSEMFDPRLEGKTRKQTRQNNTKRRRIHVSYEEEDTKTQKQTRQNNTKTRTFVQVDTRCSTPD